MALGADDQARLTDAGALLLGAREHTAVPAYLKNADVLVVPHVVTEFTDSLDPIKVYEYLAAGRPVVSTPVAGFRELDDDAGRRRRRDDLPRRREKTLSREVRPSMRRPASSPPGRNGPARSARCSTSYPPPGAST